MKLYGGVDGGGTRTRAVIVDAEGRVLGRGDVPGAVVTARDPAPAADAVRRAIGEAMESVAMELLTRDAGLDGIELPLTALWAGLAGAGSTGAVRGVTEALSEFRLAHRLHVGTDVEATYHDAFPDGGGVLLIAGTGSIAWTVEEDGRSRRAGGWGGALGDEGSGYWIGLRALRHTVRSGDGRDSPGPLAEAVLSRTGVDAPDGLVGWVERAEKRDVAALVPVVVEAAAERDASAAGILREAVEELVALVTAVGATTGADPATPVALWGGLIAEGGPLRAAVVAGLEASGREVVAGAIDPAHGAARLALTL